MQRPHAGNLGTDDPVTVLANARKALFIMAGFLAVIWVVQIASWADHYSRWPGPGLIPGRPSRRVNPRPRYRAMDQHFAATGRARPGGP
jgi:hypothetical protein